MAGHCVHVGAPGRQPLQHDGDNPGIVAPMTRNQAYRARKAAVTAGSRALIAGAGQITCKTNKVTAMTVRATRSAMAIFQYAFRDPLAAPCGRP
jgi:hypothetical protein